MKYDVTSSEYFNSLPEIVKESVMQSGLDFQTEEELREFVKSYNNK